MNHQTETKRARLGTAGRRLFFALQFAALAGFAWAQTGGASAVTDAWGSGPMYAGAGTNTKLLFENMTLPIQVLGSTTGAWLKVTIAGPYWYEGADGKYWKEGYMKREQVRLFPANGPGKPVRFLGRGHGDIIIWGEYLPAALSRAELNALLQTNNGVGPGITNSEYTYEGSKGWYVARHGKAQEFWYYSIMDVLKVNNPELLQYALIPFFDMDTPFLYHKGKGEFTTDSLSGLDERFILSRFYDPDDPPKTIGKSLTASQVRDFAARSVYAGVDDGRGGVIIARYTGSEKNRTFPSTLDGKKVTGIGADGYALCGGWDWSGLESIVIPEGVTSIGSRAFARCAALKTVRLPSTLKSIGESAFDECESLPGVSLPAGLTSIGKRAFASCRALTSVTLSSGLISIGEYAFWDCQSLKGVNLPSGLTSIGENAFAGCLSLAGVNLPASLTSIGENAFFYCAIESVTIPDRVSVIEADTFSNCNNLKSVTIGKGVRAIGESAFSIWSAAFTAVTFAEGSRIAAADFSTAAFPGNLREKYLAGGAGLYSRAKDGSWVAGVIVPSAEEAAFAKLRTDLAALRTGTASAPGTVKLGAITLSEEVGVEIGNAIKASKKYLILDLSACAAPDDRLEYMPSNEYLKGVILPSSLKTIGQRSMSIDYLTSVTIGNKVTDIERAAFIYCYELTSIVIPDSVTTIGIGAFKECQGLTSVSIGSGVTGIEQYTFDGCKSLTSVSIGKGVASIGAGAFSRCNALTSVTFAPGSRISAENFSANDPFPGDLREKYLAGGAGVYTRAAGGSAWTNISAAPQGTVSKPVTVTEQDLAKGAYTEHTGIRRVVVAAGVKEIPPNAFRGCTILESVTIPASVKTIGRVSFSDCGALANVTLAEGLTTIGVGAFRNCTSLKSITIPASVKTVSSGAFAGCTALDAASKAAIRSRFGKAALGE